METIKKYYTKYEEVIKYLIFGVLTTIVNFVTYYLLITIVASKNGSVDALLHDIGKFFEILKESEQTVAGNIGNITATIVSIFFAYFTNKKFVFESKNNTKKEFMKEISSFFSCRIFSMLVDSFIYWVGCTLMQISGGIVKLFSQVVITILNYVFSKLIIFKKKKD